MAKTSQMNAQYQKVSLPAARPMDPVAILVPPSLHIAREEK